MIEKYSLISVIFATGTILGQPPSSAVILQPLESIQKPAQLDTLLFDNLADFAQERTRLDQLILKWCEQLQADDLDQSLHYTNFKGETHNKRLGDMILHLFLHQVHHRGQISTLLSQQHIDFGETDLPELVPNATLMRP